MWSTALGTNVQITNTLHEFNKVNLYGSLMGYIKLVTFLRTRFPANFHGTDYYFIINSASESLIPVLIYNSKHNPFYKQTLVFKYAYHKLERNVCETVWCPGNGCLTFSVLIQLLYQNKPRQKSILKPHHTSTKSWGPVQIQLTHIFFKN